MKKITTSTGFTFDLNEKLLDDMRLVRQIRTLEAVKDNDSATLRIVNDVLEKFVGGAENYDKLLDHLENISEDGVAHSTAIISELTDILNALGDDGKKF